MALEVHVVSLAGTLPAMRWNWDAETDMLGGSFALPVTSAGYTGTVELNDADGSTVVLDVSGGVLCGIDFVVWPSITNLPGLAAPVEAQLGQVVVASRAAGQGASSLEFDTTLSLTADPAEEVFHLRIGTHRPVEPVRVADHWLVDIDASDRLAGFWLEGVPPLPELT